MTDKPIFENLFINDKYQKEMDALPILARGAALRFLLTRLYDFTHTPKDALVVVKDPMEYWDKLQFHKTASSPRDYGWEL